MCERQTVKENYWHDSNEDEFKSYLQYAVVFALIALYWANIYGFYMNMTIAGSVKDGMASIDVAAQYWVCFVAFFALYVIFVLFLS